MAGYSIVKTKLTPPMVKKQFLRRPHLVKKGRLITEYPVTLVHSGPGFGKSTMLSEVFDEKLLPSYWYTVTEQDDDLAVFISYLIHAFRINLPNFGAVLEGVLEDQMLRERTDELSALFVNELAQIKEEAILMIDDVHLVYHHQAIKGWLSQVVQYLPRNLHLVLSGRTKPAWQVLTTLKVKGNLLEISERDFRLDREEIDVLVNDVLQLHLDEDQISYIFEKTEGWMMAVQLIARQFFGKSTIEHVSANHEGTLEDLFGFLAFDVLSRQSVELQDILKKLSIFEEINEEVIHGVLGSDHPIDIIRQIVGQNLFLVSVGGNQYRFHALFREFLLKEFKKRNADEYMTLHEQAGDYFFQKGDDEQAIQHYRKINHQDKVARTLARYGSTMIKMGRLDRLEELLLAIPERLFIQFPALYRFQGEIYRYRCQYDLAVRLYEQALQLVGAGQEDEEIAVLEGLARVYLDTIQPAKAKDFLDRAVRLMEGGMVEIEQEQKVILYRLMAENLVNLGRAREVEEWAKRTPLLRSDSLYKENIEARMYLRTGRFEHAKKLLHRQKAAELTEENHLQLSHRETDLLLSLIHSFQGNPDSSEREAEEGIVQGIRTKAPFVEACGWIRKGHAIQLSGDNEMEESKHCYTKALEMMETIQIPRGKAEPLMGLGILFCKKGEFERAKQYARQALDETEKVNDDWLSALIKICIGMIFYYEGQYELALDTLEECRESFTQCGDEYGLSVIQLWKALIAYEQSDMARLDGAMSRLLELLHRNEYDYLLSKPTLFGPFDLQQIPPLLLMTSERMASGAFMAGEVPISRVGQLGGKGVKRTAVPELATYLDFVMSKLGIEKDQTPPGHTVKVQMLGNFRAWLGHHEIKNEDWRRDKAKELFQYLLTKRGKWVEKQEMLSALWPSQDEASAASGLKVALNALNNALEPHRKARQKPFFIEREGTAYRLNSIGSAIRLDVTDFEALLRQGLEEQDRKRAKHWLEKGLLFYKGDFLQERRLDDWSLEERERLHVLYLRGAEKLAQISVSLQEYDQAITWCQLILQKDSCWEEAYRLLIFCYYQKNNRPQAIKWYEKCCRVLDGELGVKPMPATEQMYRIVVGSEL